MTTNEIKTASNLELTSKAIYAVETLTRAERETMLKTLTVRESMKQVRNANLLKAIAKLTNSLK